jgi:predicted aspartyl protease
VNSRLKLLFAVVLSLAAGMRAVSFGAALFAGPTTTKPAAARVSIPRPVRFRETRGRGLLASVWVNSVGPFTFAIDTGAGATLVSSRVATEARLTARSDRGRSIAGLSGSTVTASETSVQELAIGDRDNYLPATGDVMITSGLPRDIDGVLDPTEVFSPLGYVIDIPRGELSAFDPRETPIRISVQPAGGAVVPWLREGRGRRPFVQLDNGDRALIDTGSSFGLAVRDLSPTDRDNASFSRDVGGGRVSARRGRAQTVSVGALTLRNVPTDFISGSHAEAPTLLGLSALRPFRISFDPVHRLIEIAPS